MSFIGNSLSAHVVLRLRFSQGRSESSFRGVFPTFVFGTPPKTDTMTVIVGVIFQILGANGKTGENRVTSCLRTIHELTSSVIARAFSGTEAQACFFCQIPRRIMPICRFL